ncbi:anti-sigma factor domain-containing protein [Lacinutrix jangbogonensis]|uniref:anti-sigma factor domain-containing protein n=1 Tax=Lacinutrix jangbogonensis TaxID=1469557 RepID=UPI00053E63DB|nr:anti-sigma factor [Lacinutrix jangbogonensis]
MSNNKDTFLKSDLLERYLTGQTNTQESIEVESYINTFPEIKEAYNTLQNKLELVAFANAEEAPTHLLGNILESLDEKPVIILNEKQKKSSFNFGIAASIAALVFAGSSVYFYFQNQDLVNENQVIVDELYDLRSDIDQNNSKLNALAEQFSQLNNPETEKYILNGNLRAKNLKTVAYINSKEKTSMIDVVSLPILPENQEYQIWAELQDKQVNLGILSIRDRRLQQIPYTKDALGLSITIEEKGVKPNNNRDTPVAEIELKIED